MSLEEMLRDSLRRAAEGYEAPDAVQARARFLARLRRRRLLRPAGWALAGAGAAAAALAVASASAPPVREARPEPLGAPVERSVRVGPQPDGVAVHGGSAWVVGSGQAALLELGPEGGPRRVARLRGTPEDVAATAGRLWVSDACGGFVTPVSPAGDDGTPVAIPGARGHSLDLAVTPGVLWTVSPGSGLVAVDAGGARRVPTGARAPTDVAAGAGAVWVLDGDRLIEVDPATRRAVDTVALDPPVSSSSDLAVAGGGVWVANPGSAGLLRVDALSGEVTVRQALEGEWAALSPGRGGLWVLVGRTGGGELRLVDPADGRALAAPLALPGRPYDVAAGAGAVWVVDRGGWVRVVSPGRP